LGEVAQKLDTLVRVDGPELGYLSAGVVI